jgi:hypothetical protein
MINNLIKIVFNKSNNQSQGISDLTPRGVKSTIPCGGDYNEVWEHIHKSRLDLYYKSLNK